MEDSDRLLLILDGALHQLPFAALQRPSPDGERHYLLAWKPFHSSVSATVQAKVLRQRGAAKARDFSDFTAFGDPQYSTLTKIYRSAMFEAVAESSLKGLIFTFVWAFEF